MDEGFREYVIQITGVLHFGVSPAPITGTQIKSNGGQIPNSILGVQNPTSWVPGPLGLKSKRGLGFRDPLEA